MRNSSKTLTFICYCVLTAVSLSPLSGKATPADPGFSGGKGTKSDPYRVASPEQLNEVRSYPRAYFILTADIDLGSAPWNEGTGWKPVGRSPEEAFSGSFNGNGYQISNLTIRMTDSLYVGIFGRLTGAEVRDVRLVNVSVTGGGYTGALAGVTSGGTLTGLNISGSVTGTGECTGGLFGMVSGTTVYNSRSEASVTGRSLVGGLAGSGMADGCSASGKVSAAASGAEGTFGTGGLLGEGRAVNCHAGWDVTGEYQVGGLIGAGSATGCYATGNVTATGDYAGGLIGDLVPFGDDQGTEQEYIPGMVALPDPVTKTKNTTSVNGQPTRIYLEDSTRVLIPAFPSPLKITLEKKGFDISVDEIFPPGSDFRPTGSMRQLTIKGTGDPLAVKPVITIPAGEAGTVNFETINAVRVGSLYVNGELVKNHSAVLPVFMDENGNFKFIDALFPDGITPDSLKTATTGRENQQIIPGDRQITETAWVGNVRYFLITFDQSLNWSKRPVLERMFPDSTLASDGFRKPWRRVSPAEREKVSNQPICNVVILVHGHPEGHR